MKQSKNGSALLVVVGSTAIVVGVAAMLHLSTSRQSRFSVINRDRLKARMIAELGLNKSYNKIKKKFDLVDEYSVSQDFANGYYKVTGKRFTGEKEKRGQLTAKGVCGLSTVIVSADLEARPINLGNDSGSYVALDTSIFVNGTLFGRGNGNYTVSSIHANNNITFKGSTDFYTPPDLSSGGDIDLGKKQTGDVGTQDEYVDQKPIPQVPVDTFIAVAEKNGQVYDSVNDLPANPPGGVAVCTATSAKWNDEDPQTGCYIFMGSFQISSGLNLNADPSTGYPALIVMGTSVHISGSGNKAWHHINGAVYAPNAAMHITGSTIRGPIVCGQDFDYSGTGSVFGGGTTQGFSLPPEESIAEKVVITAWH